MDIPAGAIPVDQFQAATPSAVASETPPPGAIPVDQFEAAPPPGAILVDQFQSQHDAYNTPGQTIAAGVEGLAKGFLGPVAPYLERIAGISPQSQRERELAHPNIEAAANVAGLGLGLFTGTGEAALMTKAGEAATHLIGLGELAKNAPLIARVGSSAVAQAAEMAVLQSGDEVSKKILQDPDASAQHALAHIGLASALGAGTGAIGTGIVSPLWKATVGPKVEGAFKALFGRMGGIEGAEMATADQLEKDSGVVLFPETKAIINDAPGARASHSVLSQSDHTLTGRSYQKKILGTQTELLGNKVAESLGKTPEAVELSPDLDKYSRGREIGDTLKSEIEPVAKEIGSRYEKVTDEFKNSSVTEVDRQIINEQIAQKALERGWGKAESDTVSKFADNVMGKMSKQETLDDLKKFITNLNDAHPFGSPTYQAAKDIKTILKDTQERIISSNLLRTGASAEDAAAKLAEYNQLKGNYKSLMGTIDGLNEHLHVGSYEGPQSFLKALSELSSTKGERVLERSLGSKNANMLEMLKQFPQTLEKVKQFHIDSLLDKASSKTAEGVKLNVNNLLKNIEGLSPQVKGLIANPEQHKAIDAVGKVLETLKDPHHNWSNTGRTAEKLVHASISPLSLLAMAMGHANAGLFSFLGKLGFNEGKDALRLGMMKFLSSSQPIKAEGMKATMAYMDAVYKNDSLLSKATEAVFKPGLQVLSNKYIPSSSQLDKLEKLVSKNDTDHALEEQNTNLGHYMPDHQATTTKAVSQAKAYLQSLQPHPIKIGVLDKEMPPPPAAVARYRRALEIAQQPAVVLQKCKDGTLQNSDLIDLQSMYPSVYKNMSEKLMHQMITRTTEDEPIPYKTRLCLSLFLAQPLDSTMKPESIIAAQPQPRAPAQQQAQGQKPSKDLKSLDKGSKSYQTPQQSSEHRRITHD